MPQHRDILTVHDLYTPSDVHEAWDTWHASCGQAALAAMLRCPVQAVRFYFPGHFARGYTNVTQMTKALDLARQFWTHVHELSAFRYGVAFVQWTGPWTQPGVPARTAYPHTHWIGYARLDDGREMVYDVNIAIGWVDRTWWETYTVPLLTSQHKGADGWYSIRWACNIGAYRNLYSGSKGEVHDA